MEEENEEGPKYIYITILSVRMSKKLSHKTTTTRNILKRIVKEENKRMIKEGMIHNKSQQAFTCDLPNKTSTTTTTITIHSMKTYLTISKYIYIYIKRENK